MVGSCAQILHAPSRKPFLKRRGRSRRCCMRPVPVVFRRLPFTDQLTMHRKPRMNIASTIVFAKGQCKSRANARRAIDRARIKNTIMQTYSCAAWQPGSRTGRTSSSGCGRSGFRSGGTACAICRGAHRTTWYLSSTSIKRSASATQKSNKCTRTTPTTYHVYGKSIDDGRRLEDCCW